MLAGRLLTAPRQVGSVTVAAGLLLVAGLVDVATRGTPGPRMNMVKPSQSTMLYDIPNFGTNSEKYAGCELHILKRLTFEIFSVPAHADALSTGRGELAEYGGGGQGG
jgi:hypothetical protein